MMKVKRIVSTVFAVFAAFLAQATEHRHCICGTGACAVEGHQHADVTWESWTATDSLPTTAGRWFLTDDVVLNATYEPVDGVELCLNGHSVSQNDPTTLIVEIKDGVTLTLTDCGTAVHYFTDSDNDGCYETVSDVPTEGAIALTGGYITGCWHEEAQRTAIGIDAGGALELYAGNVVGNYSGNSGLYEFGGAVNVGGKGARLTMYGGEIAGNATPRGGAINVNDGGKAILAGGRVRRNKAYWGGALYLEHHSSAELSGAEIAFNSAGSASGAIWTEGDPETAFSALTMSGGTVHHNEEGGISLHGDFTMTGGTICSNRQEAGVSVFQMTGARLTLGGTARVFDNTDGSEAQKNILLYNYDWDHLNPKVDFSTTVPPEGSGNFGLSAANLWDAGDAYVFATNKVESYLKYFTVDDPTTSLRHKDGDLIIYRPQVVSVYAQAGKNSAVSGVYADGVKLMDEGPWYDVTKDSAVEVVFVADNGMVFTNGLATITNAVVATEESTYVYGPDAFVLEYVASVTVDGVTTEYTSLMDAWAYATNGHDQVDVSVTLLKDVTVGEPLIRTVSGITGQILTLDLNDCALAYAGEDDMCFIQQTGGTAMHIIDTAPTRTPRYFIRDDETGRWTLTDTETDLTVSGGVITGARAGAASFTYGSGMVSNVNFVGNYSAYDGGAVKVMSGTVSIFNSTFLGNATAGNGGAVYVAADCKMSDCRVESNVAGNQGGGLYSKTQTSLVRTRIVNNRAGMEGGGVCLTKVSSCLAAGTKILMGDGSERNIEDIVEGDVIATFDHEGGTKSSAAVCLAYSGEGAFPAVTLTFASGTKLTIVGCHDLLSETTRKYVTLTTENAADFIGARFYDFKTASWDELAGVASAGNLSAFYSLYTAHHLNCVANGLLTVADDVDWYLNIYELDESLKADPERLAADIAEFGLLGVDEYPSIAENPKEYDDFNFRYARIAIGKGLVTADVLWNLLGETNLAETPKPSLVSRPKLMTAAPLMTLGVSEPIAAPSAPYIQVGEGVVVTGNVASSGADSNVYLDRDKNAVIDILPEATGIDVGVTLSSGAGIFGWTNAVNHAASFFADDPTYTVSYTADGELALRAGIQVGGDAWATVDADGTCTIIGTGAMWNHGEWTAGNPLAAQRKAIRSVVVADGVTSVGSRLFHKFYALTNVTCSASVTSVGQLAFYNCITLERLAFGTKPVCGEEVLFFHSAIYMKDGAPTVKMVPEIEVAGYRKVLEGKVTLADPWQDVTEENKGAFRFFRFVLREVD